jgi:DNA-binding NtrC family response regulator
MVVLAAGDSLSIDDVPSILENDLDPGGHVAIPAGTKLEDLEHEAVMQALEQFDGNRTRAAEALGISVRTLQRKLKAWGVNGHEDEKREA